MNPRSVAVLLLFDPEQQLRDIGGDPLGIPAVGAQTWSCLTASGPGGGRAARSLGALLRESQGRHGFDSR